MKNPKLSIIIPAYNESERFKKTLPQIIRYFKPKKYSKEIIIVDDGSTDKTVSTIHKLTSNSDLVRVIALKKNQGKGAAIRKGVSLSTGDWILFMDADLSTPLKELDKFWSYSKNFPIIIGSRKMAGANVTKHQSFVRENLGKIFTHLTNSLATKGISDITCGFKMYRGKVGRKLFKKSRLNDWSFDAEVLFLAQLHKHQIKEIPVTWRDDPRTKVNIFTDGINAFLGLLKIRLNQLNGKY